MGVTYSDGFKLIAYKEMSFHRIEKKLYHGGTTANLYKLVCDGLILSRYKRLRKYRIIPPQAGENQCFPFWKRHTTITQI